MTVIGVVVNTIGNLSTGEDPVVGEKTAQLSLIFHVLRHAGVAVEHFQEVVVHLVAAARLAVNVQGKIRISQNGPWTMTLMGGLQQEGHLTLRVRNERKLISCQLRYLFNNYIEKYAA